MTAAQRAILSASLVLAGLAAGPARPTEWVKVKDPHGFEVKLPKGWSARALATGQVVFSPEAETLLGPQACVWTLHMKKSKPAAEVARALVAAYKAVIPGLTAQGPHQLKGRLSDSCSMRGKMKVLGTPWSYVFVVSVKGKVAIMTGFAAPQARCAALKPVFASILASFKLNEKLRDPKRIAPPAGKWVKWTDPKEKAFSLMVPKGWQVDAKISGVARPYLDASFWFVAKKGGKDSTAISLLDAAPPLYTEPMPMMAQLGFREGMPYNPSGGVTQNMIIMRYLGAQGYIKNMYFPQVKKTCPDAKLHAVLKRPDLARALPKNPWIRTSYDGAEGRLSGTVGGVKVTGRAYVLAARIIPPGMTTGLWFVKLGTVCAPPKEFERAYDIFWRIRNSFRIDPQWAAREARAVIQRSKIISANANQMADQLHKSYETRSRTMDEISRKWSNATLGQADLRNPETGEVRYGVPSGSNYYWEVGGKVIGTETHTRPDMDAVELQNLDDLRRG